jgi:hypothetical protein
LSVFWPFYCLSFGHCIVCLLAIVLSVFWPLCCLSFGHCVVCLLAIVLSVFHNWKPASLHNVCNYFTNKFN